MIGYGNQAKNQVGFYNYLRRYKKYFRIAKRVDFEDSTAATPQFPFFMVYWYNYLDTEHSDFAGALKVWQKYHVVWRY